MPAAYKVLGQALSVAATNATLYTVPAGGQTIVSSIYICNTAIAATQFTIRVQKAGDAANDRQALFSNSDIAGRGTVALTGGITLAAGDQLIVMAQAAGVSFQAFGQETT
jgi:hypothetical protein